MNSVGYIYAIEPAFRLNLTVVSFASPLDRLSKEDPILTTYVASDAAGLELPCQCLSGSAIMRLLTSTLREIETCVATIRHCPGIVRYHRSSETNEGQGGILTNLERVRQVYCSERKRENGIAMPSCNTIVPVMIKYNTSRLYKFSLLFKVFQAL